MADSLALLEVRRVSTEDLRERVRRIPGMERLLPALDGLPPVYLVGGAVRDLLLGERSLDIDLAVEGDVRSAARELARRLDGDVVGHDRFGTATVHAPDLRVDLAMTRKERYPRPGALPEVEPATLTADLARRDFSINAMAIALQGDELGHLHDPFGGVRDLTAGIVRVLHERSFVDDPTRLLRALRYETRLGFQLDPETERLAREAAARSLLRLVSGPRVRDELLPLLEEIELIPRALRRMRELGIDRSLHPALTADPQLAADAALAANVVGASRRLSALAALLARDPEGAREWLDELALRAPARDAVERAARRGRQLATLLGIGELRPSQIYELLAPEPPEALAVALALGAPQRAIADYVNRLRHVQLEISGRDLVAAGVPESPLIGRALRAVLRLKLDGRVSGREEELAAALAEVRLAEEAAGRGGDTK